MMTNRIHSQTTHIVGIDPKTDEALCKELREIEALQARV